MPGAVTPHSSLRPPLPMRPHPFGVFALPTAALAIAAVLAPAAAHAQKSANPYSSYGVPASDTTGWAFSGILEGRFRIESDTAVRHGGAASLRLEPDRRNRGGGALLQQAIRAEAYRGKRVRVRSWVRTEDVARATMSSSVYAAVDGSITSVRSYTNGIDAPIAGTSDWTLVERIVEVPANAEYMTVTFAFTQSMATVTSAGITPPRPAGGILWIDDVSIEVVGAEVPLSVNSASGKVAPCCPDTPAQVEAKRAWIATLAPALVNGGFEVRMAGKTR